MKNFNKNGNQKVKEPIIENKIYIEADTGDAGEIGKGAMNIIDVIAPSYIDTRDPKHLVIDDMYISSLLVINYNRQQEAGWLDPLLSLDINADVSMFYERLNPAKAIRDITYHIGNTGAALKTTGENQQDIDIIETTYGDARYIRREMQVNREDLYYLYFYITIYADNRKDLEYNIQRVESLCAGIGLQTRRANFRQEQAFICSLPLGINSRELKNAVRRNVLTSGLASTYPFVSAELCDNDGVLIGYNEHNKSLVVIDRFNTALYKNANMCILGTSGAGKSYLVKLLVLRHRYMDISQMIIDPDREYGKVCSALGGTLFKVGPSSSTFINVMEIRESSFEEEDDRENTGSKGLLASKINKLHTFFSLVFPDMTPTEKAYLDEKLVECYAAKGITFEDGSLYDDGMTERITVKRRFKSSRHMPILGDLYELLKEDDRTHKLAVQLRPYVEGSLKFFNNHTNINLENKLIAADIHDLDDEQLPIGMFIIMDLFWDKIKEDRFQKKIIYLDELWRLIGSSGNAKAANFVYKIFKTIRKYGGAGTAITQDVSDFFALEGGKYGKAIVNNSKLKFILQLEEEDVKVLKNILNLSEEEESKVQTFERGTGLFYAGKNHVAIKVEASAQEHELITTDRKDLELMKKFAREEENTGRYIAAALDTNLLKKGACNEKSDICN